MNANNKEKKKGFNGMGCLERYFQDISCSPLLTPSETKKWARRYRLDRNDLEARDILVTGYLRYVVSMAKSLCNRGLDFLDLIQEGNIGLMIGMGKYDERKGFTVTTYVKWAIRRAMERAITSKGNTIRMPYRMYGNRQEVFAVIDKLAARGVRYPDAKQIAWLSGLSPRSVELVLRSSFFNVISSLDEKLNGFSEDGDLSTLGEVTPDESAIDPMFETHKNLVRKDLAKLLSILSPRERTVLEMRFGLVDGEPCTLEKVGIRFRITRERVRQVQNKALKKLRQIGMRKLLS